MRLYDGIATYTSRCRRTMSFPVVLEESTGDRCQRSTPRHTLISFSVFWRLGRPTLPRCIATAGCSRLTREGLTDPAMPSVEGTADPRKSSAAQRRWWRLSLVASASRDRSRVHARGTTVFRMPLRGMKALTVRSSTPFRRQATVELR